MAQTLNLVGLMHHLITTGSIHLKCLLLIFFFFLN